MSRYIDADVLQKDVCISFYDDYRDGFGLADIASIIDNQPTVDAVPVSYIYKRAMELKNDDMMYAYTVLNSLIANYRADGERKEKRKWK